jgi:hypothetical protein
VLLLAVLALAFVFAKTCAAKDDQVSYEEAEAIAREKIEFQPDKVLVRGINRGLESKLFWAVSLSTTNSAGIRVDCATVLVDAATGEAETQAC